MNETYKLNHVIVEAECGEDGQWQMQYAFSAMERAMNEHCLLLKCSRRDILNSYGLVWMLARIKVCFSRLPREGESILIKTWPGASGRVTYPRFVEFVLQGDLIGCSSSSWLAVDFQKRRLVLPNKCGISLPDTSSLVPPLREPDKLSVPEEGERTIRIVEENDLDLNAHMNNARYAAWIGSLYSRPLHELCIEYSQEAVKGQRIVMIHKESENGITVSGKDAENGTTVFKAKGK